MERIIIFSLLMVASQGLFAQRIKDPGYSAGNYKHPNKAAYARLHDLDKWTMLETTTVERKDNYKQPFNKTLVKSSAILTSKPNNNRSSYKHPQGL